MYCGKCGTERVEGEGYCRSCGTAFEEPSEHPAEPTSVTTPSAPVDDEPFSGGMTVGAGLLTVFMPLIALIVALIMRGGEVRPSRRGFLRTWAIASGAWLCTGWVIGLLLLTSGSIGGGGGCQGGPDPFGVPSFVSSDNKHWTAVVPCVNGGSKSRPATPAEDRMLNK